MPVTINDVANEAGVSKSTVSKVLNNWSTISPETTKRVHDAIKKLHYIPNQRAVSFAKQTTQNIVYLTNLGKDTAYQNPHMFDIMCGVYKELSAKGYTLTLVDTSDESYPGEKASQEIRRRCADGLIIHGSAVNKELATLIISEAIPHIIIGHPSFDCQLCWIDTNHALAGEYAARHMLQCDYTDVVFIGGRKTDVISSQRLKGFLSGMLDGGYYIHQDHIVYTDARRQGAYETTLSYLSATTLPQAIICENNTLALGVMKAISEKRLSVPQDIAILTFDVYPYSGIIDPKLTIIDIDVYNMGVEAGNMMIRKLENPDLLVQSFTTLPVLVQGESTIPK